MAKVPGTSCGWAEEKKGKDQRNVRCKNVPEKLAAAAAKVELFAIVTRFAP